MLNYTRGDPARPGHTLRKRGRVPRILITGVPGAGKSSIASGVGRIIAGVSVCEFGKLMARIGEQRNIVIDYGELPKLALIDRIQLQEAAAAHVAGQNQPVAIAAHLVVQAPEGYVDGLPPQALASLKLTAIIVVICDPRQIHGRRARDEGGRETEDIDLIATHQELVRKRAAMTAELQGLPFAEIVNLDGELTNAVERAVALWRSFEAVNG